VKTCRPNGPTETLALGPLVTAAPTLVAQLAATSDLGLQTNHAHLKTQSTMNPSWMTKIAYLPARQTWQKVGIPPVETEIPLRTKTLQVIDWIPQFSMKALPTTKISRQVITTRTAIVAQWTSKQILMRLDQTVTVTSLLD